MSAEDGVFGHACLTETVTELLTVQIDGEMVDPKTASIPITDVGFTRGYGVFEAIRAYDGTCFRLQPHLDRLTRSAAMLGLDLPSDDDLTTWCNRAAVGLDESVVRIMVSAGDDVFSGDVRVVVTSQIPAPRSPETTLFPVFAPWHADGTEWELLAAKTISYANNVGSTRQAILNGFDDALLIGRSGNILEGPNFCVGWVVEEQGRAIYETPAMSLGILDSITRQAVFDVARDMGFELREIEVGLDHLDDATDFFVFSTLRDTLAATSVGERTFPVGPHTLALRQAMHDRIAFEVGR